MSYAERNMKLTDLAIILAAESKRLGMALGAGMSDGVIAERTENERRAWQDFSDALWGKDSPTPTEVPGGVKSAPAQDLDPVTKIHAFVNVEDYPG
ncbi:MAG: hypothetical protein ABFE16_00825, partial [Armatimonadia bacterium]